MFVIVRDTDGAFVAPPGQPQSYTPRLDRAWTFRSRNAAACQACGNERVASVESLMGAPADR